MKRLAVCRSCAVLVLALLNFPVAIGSQDTVETRASLRGLPGVQVLVEPVGDDAERDGLHRTDLQRDVELKLRLAGIRVLSEREMLESEAQPTLYVVVTALRRNLGPVPLGTTTRGVYAYNIGISVRQAVTLANGDVSVFASTWDVGGVGATNADQVAEVRDLVKDRVDAFINAWLSANPK